MNLQIFFHDFKLFSNIKKGNELPTADSPHNTIILNTPTILLKFNEDKGYVFTSSLIRFRLQAHTGIFYKLDECGWEMSAHVFGFGIYFERQTSY